MGIGYLVAIAVASVSLLVSLYTLYRVESLARRISRLISAASSEARVLKEFREAASKPRKRYIVFEVQSTREYSEKEVAKAIIAAAREVLGETGLVDSGLHLIAYYPERRIGILRVRNTYKYRALAILGLVRDIRGEKVRLVPLYTSGTLKKALKRAGVRKK